MDGLDDPYWLVGVADDCKGSIRIEIDQDHESLGIFVHTIKHDPGVIMVKRHQYNTAHAIDKELLQGILAIRLPHNNGRIIKSRMRGHNGPVVMGNAQLSDIIEFHVG